MQKNVFALFRLNNFEDIMIVIALFQEGGAKPVQGGGAKPSTIFALLANRETTLIQKNDMRAQPRGRVKLIKLSNNSFFYFFPNRQ